MSALPKFKQPAQYNLFPEAQQYHHLDKWGYFSLLTRNSMGKTAQSSHRLDTMPTVLGLVDPHQDTWLSQAEFMRPNRRVVNLLRVGLLFCDIDCYPKDKQDPALTQWAQGKSPEAMAQALLYFCQLEGIPAPSVVVFSGRGLQVKWLLEGTIPRQALPRWNACQRHLVDKLRPYGADPAAKDASRVLRLVDTVNTRSGEICRVVHVTPGNDGQAVRYSFEELAEYLLPVARWKHEAKQAEAQERRKHFQLLQGGRKPGAGLRRFSDQALAWHRLEDLRTLAQMRGGVAEGERMQHLFWQLNFMLLSGATNSGDMWHEAAELARQIDSGWGYRSPELSTLYSKAKSYEAGEKVTFKGRELAPLYTPRNDTLINLFGITDDEQKKLRTIISTSEAKGRHAKRTEASRRAAGAIERAAYLGQAQGKRTQALELRAQGKSWAEVAQAVGYKSADSARIACRP